MRSLGLDNSSHGTINEADLLAAEEIDRENISLPLQIL
jgi:hypothetical protein